MFGDLGKDAKEALISAVQHRFDSWQNLLTGQGTSRDKRLGSKFAPDMILDPAQLEMLYNGDDMCARAVELVVDQAFKKGVDLTSGDAEDASQAKDEQDETLALLEELEWEEKTSEAATWGRLFGAGAILLGVSGSGKPEEPLIDERVTSLDFLTVLDRRDLQVVYYYGDPLAPKYGQAMIYRLQPISMSAQTAPVAPLLIHETRLQIFGGQRTSKRSRIQNQSWPLSVIQRMHDVLRDFNASWSSVSHMMTDANMGVFKMKNFLQMIAGRDVDDMQTRMQIADMYRSTMRSYVCDADMETFDRVATSFAGIPDILDRMCNRLAAAANMPVTRLFGIAPAGLNATGKSDQDNFDDDIADFQRKKLKKPMTRIARLAAQTIGVSNPKAMQVVFPPLRQLDPLQEATRRLNTAQADGINIDKGIYIPEEITLARTKAGKFSSDEPIVDLEVRKRALDAELKAHEENAGKPPVVVPPNLPAENQSQSIEATGGDVTDPADVGGTLP